MDGVVAVGVVAIAMGIESSAEARGRDLSAVGVAAKHPLPGMFEKFFSVCGIVVQTDDREGGINFMEGEVGVEMAGPLVVEADDREGDVGFFGFDVEGFVSKADEAVIFQAFLKEVGTAEAFCFRSFAVDAVVVIAQGADDPVSGFEMREDFGDARGEAIAASDEVARDNNDVRF